MYDRRNEVFHILERIIKKWWFYVVCLVLLFIPSITQQHVSPEDTSKVVQVVMQESLIYNFKLFFPIAKLILLFLLAGGFIWKRKFAKLFSLIVFLLLFLIAILQNTALKTEYGYAILLGNILIQFIVIISWIDEFRVSKNNFSEPRFRWWSIVLFILATFAFWMPALNGNMNFSLKGSLLNESGLTYCMVTPFILAILLLYYPHINIVNLRITSFVGFLFGLLNMVTWFILNTDFWWMGIVHLPLLIISLTGLVLSKQSLKN